MIYAINQKTKKHIIMQEGHGFDGLVTKGEDGDFWRLVEADPDGWIEWEGKQYESPIPADACCEVRLSSGDVFIIGDPEDWDWSRGGDQWVTAYRPILDAEPSEPEAPEWDGEGMPPVGAWIEAKDDYSQWQRCRVSGREGAHLWLDYEDDGYATGHMDDLDIRPIRTPAQRAEEAMARVMYECDLAGNISAKEAANALYACIRDGKIPGVKLENNQ